MTPATLRVRVSGRAAAAIAREPSGTTLTYHADYLSRPDAVPLSLSLPLRAQPHAGPSIATWLDGLLPDRPADREQWRALAGATSVDPFDLLGSPIGSECAGAVQFERADTADSPDPAPALRAISDAELAAALNDLRDGALPGGWRADPLASFSLAGTMPKLALRRRRGRWHIALGDEPTSHLLKPSLRLYPGHAVGEHLALATARRLGIDAAYTEVGEIGGVETLIVQRFDRVAAGTSATGRSADLPCPPAELERIHQEDMCQALGFGTAQRFQRDGGPAPDDLAQCLHRHSSDPDADLAALFSRLVYCWVIVANDAHAKNHAVLHLPGSVCRLAPLYDVASWLPYTDVPAAEIHLAMTLSEGFEVGDGARLDDWRHLARTFRLSPDWAAEEVIRLARETPAHLLDEIDSLPAAARTSGTTTRLLSAITQRCQTIVG